ncbi:MAG: DUF427 domain-containing protein [Ahrensia sp.]|nr:DUF427 domain-containing protein [Ahrensia sp.]
MHAICGKVCGGVRSGITAAFRIDVARRRIHIAAMTRSKQKTSNDYAISVELLPSPVLAMRGDVVLADSDHAKLMHETRLPDIVYFPREDVQTPLRTNADRKTFCPFKGTATYFDVVLPNGVFEAGAWSYQRALKEGKSVEGLIAFTPELATEIDFGSNQPKAVVDGAITGPTVDWLMREAWLCQTPEDLTAAIARIFLADGIAVSRMSVMIWSLHPLIAGKNYIWTRQSDSIATYTPSYDIHDNPAFVNSPLRHVSNGLGGVRQRLDIDEAEFSFPIMQDLKQAGATDYVAMPLPFSNGQINVFTLTSDHPDGFTTPNLGLVFECSTVLSRFYEVFALKENAQSLLDTYLGPRTGRRVLGGEIRRGDGDEIDAAIVLCDLRGSTKLESTLGREAYLDLLNTFFEKVTDIINAHGGEVLKFIGDAVLAIFPADSTSGIACKQAIESARQIVLDVCLAKTEWNNERLIDCAIGIDFGRVTYGNIGSRERLDFTVIGAAANIAARLADHCKISGQRILARRSVAGVDPHTTALGVIELPNVDGPIEACAIDIEARYDG